MAFFLQIPYTFDCKARQKSGGSREPKLLRVGVAAFELGLHPFTVRRWIELGKIQAVRIGLEACIPRSEIERLRGSTHERLLVLYGRLCGQEQIDDLDTQLKRLQVWSKDDLLAIIASFSGRLYGMRSHKQKELLTCARDVINNP